MANKEIIKEFIQNNCKVNRITQQALTLLENKGNDDYNDEIISILNKIGYNNFVPSEKAAEIIDNIIRN